MSDKIFDGFQYAEKQLKTRGFIATSEMMSRLGEKVNMGIEDIPEHMRRFSGMETSIMLGLDNELYLVKKGEWGSAYHSNTLNT